MRGWYRLASAAALVGVALTTALGAQAQTPGDLGVVSEKDPTIKVITPEEEKALQSFWTREKIANAQPMDMPVDLGAAEIDASAQEKGLYAGAPGQSGASRAAPGADAVARAAYPEDWKVLDEAVEAEEAALAADIDSKGTSAIHTSYVVNQVSSMRDLYPHRWVGRLTFTVPGGGTSFCSATAIAGNNIVTAAHCLYDTSRNVWYSNWVFTPAYRNGTAPFGTFSWRTCQVLPAWINLTGSYAINTWARHDVAVCTMGPNSTGTTLNNAVGWAGRQWNWPSVRHFHTMGYPFRNTSDALLTNAGLYLRACAAESFLQAAETRGMGCLWSRGTSGGPMMTGYAPGVVTGWVDGVYSGFFIGTQNMYGARFSDLNIVPLCRSRGC